MDKAEIRKQHQRQYYERNKKIILARIWFNTHNSDGATWEQALEHYGLPLDTEFNKKKSTWTEESKETRLRKWRLSMEARKQNNIHRKEQERIILTIEEPVKKVEPVKEVEPVEQVVEVPVMKVEEIKKEYSYAEYKKRICKDINKSEEWIMRYVNDRQLVLDDWIEGKINVLYRNEEGVIAPLKETFKTTFAYKFGKLPQCDLTIVMC